MDYDAIADTYSRNRGGNVCIVDELLSRINIGPDSRILEVGCGTASHLLQVVETTRGQGWGLEPSSEMLRHASVHNQIELVEGRAETLPFEDDFFDLVFSVNIIHHVDNHAAYFAEAFRVLRSGGAVCTFTDSSEMIKRRMPLSEYWPASAESDLKRYPTVNSLLDQMDISGFSDITTHEIRSPFQVTDLMPYREKSFSCLHLITEDEFSKGLKRLEADLHNGPVQGIAEYLCIWGRVP